MQIKNDKKERVLIKGKCHLTSCAVHINMLNVLTSTISKK